MKIERHNIDEPFVKELFERSVSKLEVFLKGARQSSKNLYLLIDKALSIVHCGCIIDPASPHILDALHLAAQAHVALFASAASPAVSVPLGRGDSVAYSSPADESTVNVSRWILGFYLNTLCHDENGLDVLCEVTTESLRRSTTKSPDYGYFYMEALQEARVGGPETANKIIAALEATDPKRGTIEDEDWALYLIAQQLELLMYVVTQDPKFDDALGRAVQKHQKYWSKTQDRRRDYRGFISAELTALAAMGRERGLSVDLESPYLALHLAS